ncbi:MAG TPA: class I SAM-dependent methyltransferase [Acidobacteriota bacterium]|nr:class I SAM-dependent methyltransferase [Acidobacteriota bacterium]
MDRRVKRGCWWASRYDWLMQSVERRALRSYRSKLLGGVRGRVLEIGVGTGANWSQLPRRVDQYVGVERDAAMLAVAGRKHSAGERDFQFPVALIQGDGAQLPFADAQFDAVVCTLVLCSVRKPAAVLGELARVLRPGGTFLFLEHIRGEGRRARWQDLAAPVWSWIGCGCRPNRRTLHVIRQIGFRLEDCEWFDPFVKVGRWTKPFGLLLTPFVAGSAVKP